MRASIKIFLLLLLPLFGVAQQQYPDSLKRVLKTAHADSTRYSALNGIGEYDVEINGDSALFYLNRALALAKKNDRRINEAATLARIGYVLTKKGNYPESLGCFQQALKFAEDPKNEGIVWNPNIQYATLQKNRLTILATVHLLYAILMGATNDIDQEIVQLKKSRSLAEEAGDHNLAGVANMNLGSVYFGINRVDSALILEQNAAQIAEQTGKKKYLGFVYEMTGYIYLRKGNSRLAVQYAHKGLNISIEQKNFSLARENYGFLWYYYSYLSKKQKDSSLYYAKRTLDVAQSMGDKSSLDNAYEQLYQSYQLARNTDSAYKYQGLALIGNESRYSATTKSLAEFQRLSFKAQLRAQELEKEQAAAQTRMRTFVLLAAIGVFMLLAAIFYRNNRQKQKANKVLESTLDHLKLTQNQLIQSEKMASLGELTAGIAHEIQNPLNFVNNFSEVNAEMIGELEGELKSGNTGEALAIAADIKENEQKISHHGKRADAIVKGMLQHSRASGGIKEPTDINALADEYMRLSYHGLRAKDKSFNAVMETHFDDSLGKISINPQEIGRVILNVLNNAFYAVNEKKKTNPEGYEPTVTVTTKLFSPPLGARGVELSVKDNGNGIPQKILDKIYQPFFTTKPTGQGIGLGLSMSYDIIKAHGGELKVETKEGEYTEFSILLSIM